MSTMIGYARVSTAEQNLKMQEDALKRAGCYRIFTDVISGAKDKRPGLDDALAFLREGDNPYIKRLDMFIARRSSVQLDELARLRGCTKRQLVEDLLEQAWQAAKVAKTKIMADMRNAVRCIPSVTLLVSMNSINMMSVKLSSRMPKTCVSLLR